MVRVSSLWVLFPALALADLVTTIMGCVLFGGWGDSNYLVAGLMGRGVALWLVVQTAWVVGVSLILRGLLRHGWVELRIVGKALLSSLVVGYPLVLAHNVGLLLFGVALLPDYTLIPLVMLAAFLAALPILWRTDIRKFGHSAGWQ